MLFALSCLLGGWASSLVFANPFFSCIDFTPLNLPILVGIEMAEQPVNLIIDIVSNLYGLGDSEESSEGEEFHFVFILL